MLRQDITPPERVRADPKCDREVTVYGYARGCNLKPGARMHLAGVGDYPVRARLTLAGGFAEQVSALCLDNTACCA